MDKIKRIKFGLKLWSINPDLIKEAEALIKDGIFNYVELMVIPDTQIFPYQEVKIPYIIHITSDKFGFNIPDKKKVKFNTDIINQNILWVNELEAKYLILHPGFGQFKEAKNFLDKINDKRILIENMPKTGSNDEAMTGYTPEQIQELMGNKFELCLDLNHAIKAAVGLKKDYKKYIKDFLKLKPKMFHIADGTLKSGKDEHLNIGEGEYDFNFLANCVEKSNAKYVTVETPRTNLNSLKEDLENLKKLKSFLSN